MNAREDLTGKTSGFLTIGKYLGNDRYLCHCVCGETKSVLANDLKYSKTRSCGCRTNELRNAAIAQAAQRRKQANERAAIKNVKLEKFE